ncbi:MULTISPECIES: hypothetical protein [Pseudomonadaceae]|uniref:hypothetical protein n=1 Tax=Pseudomonadaceae TaxID=135621 RepID=UPI002114EB71|nr:hypothetical protein [Pseudomonas sp. Choline-3u-10]
MLDALGKPHTNGYKPWGNSQLLLRKSVQAYILKHHQAVGAIVDALEKVKLPSEKTDLAALVEASKREAFVPSPAKVRDRMPRKFDFAARDEANRRLGPGLVPNCSINGWRGIRSAPLRALYAERDSENGWSMRQFESANGDRRYA